MSIPNIAIYMQDSCANNFSKTYLIYANTEKFIFYQAPSEVA